MTADDIIDGVITREGRVYTNHPADKGGPTKYGITLDTLRKWRHDPTLTAADVEAMDEPEAQAIYRQIFIVEPGFNQVADPLRVQLIDFGVVSGPARAIRWLQRALNLPATGVLDPETRSALVTIPAAVTNNALVAARLVMNYRIIAGDKSQHVFEDGWENRAVSFFVSA